MKESIMDRVGREMAEFLQGMREERAAIAEERAAIADLRESQKETDKQIRKTSKKVENTSDTLGKPGVIDGKVAEDLFYRNVQHIFAGKIPAFSDVRRNMKKRGIPGEYDIVAVGEGMVLVVEVKKKMEQDMVDKFVDEQLPRFRQIFPEYRDFPLIGGVGALVMQDAISRYAEKKGLYVLTQNGEGGAMLINRKNFTAKEF